MQSLEEQKQQDEESNQGYILKTEHNTCQNIITSLNHRQGILRITSVSFTESNETHLQVKVRFPFQLHTLKDYQHSVRQERIEKKIGWLYVLLTAVQFLEESGNITPDSVLTNGNEIYICTFQLKKDKGSCGQNSYSIEKKDNRWRIGAIMLYMFFKKAEDLFTSKDSRDVVALASDLLHDLRNKGDKEKELCKFLDRLLNEDDATKACKYSKLQIELKGKFQALKLFATEFGRKHQDTEAKIREDQLKLEQEQNVSHLNKISHLNYNTS